MNFTRRLRGNRRLVAPTTNLRESIAAYNLTNTELQQYNRFNTNAMAKGLAPTEIPRSINASNLNRNTKKKLMHHWVRQYTGLLSPNTVRNTFKQLIANRGTRKARRSRRN
jgi:hypothetical protein